GRAGLDAFAAADAGAGAHRVVEIEDDLLAEAALGHADHVIDLHLAAGADAERAIDAGIEIDRHRRVAKIGCRHRGAGGEAAFGDADAIGPAPEDGLRRMRRRARRLVGDQQLEHHLAREFGALALRADLHAGRRLADAGRGEDALALDLDHAGAAIAVGAIAGCGLEAEMRDITAGALGGEPDRLAGESL